MASKEKLIILADIDKIATKLVEETNEVSILPEQSKQTRGFLRTTASRVGRDTAGLNLFSIQGESYTDNPVEAMRQTLAKNTAITGGLLVAMWQKKKDENGLLTINNLAEISRKISIRQDELKLHLVYLGGFEYPNIQGKSIPNTSKVEVTTGHEKLFNIKFKFEIEASEYEKLTNDMKVGTHYLSFIKGVPIKEVIFRPTDYTLGEMEGQGLGNVLVASDNYLQISLGVSDIAYKLLNFSSSQKVTYKIGFDKIIKDRNINIEKYLKKEGKPATVKYILGGLSELKDKKCLLSFDYDEKKDMFIWERTNEVVVKSEALPRAEVIKRGDSSMYVQRLARFMTKSKISVRDLAIKLGCDQSNLAKVINGKRQASGSLVIKIRELLG